MLLAVMFLSGVLLLAAGYLAYQLRGMFRG